MATPNSTSASPKQPAAPIRSRKASTWRKYYERRAHWYADHAINLAAIAPTSAAYAQAEAERFCEGARALREGRHPNQISGEWT